MQRGNDTTARACFSNASYASDVCDIITGRDKQIWDAMVLRLTLLMICLHDLGIDTAIISGLMVGPNVSSVLIVYHRPYFFLPDL